MQIISIDDISYNKILPFNLYDENGDIIFSAGEILTPGKLLQLRYMNVIYRDEFEDEGVTDEKTQKKENSLKTIQTSNNENETSTLNNPLLVSNVFNSVISPKKQDTIKDIYKTILFSPKESIKKNTAISLELRDKLIDEVLNVVDDIVYRSQLRVQGDFNTTHGINVANLCIMLAYKLKLNETQIKEIALGAMLHDIGKIRIPKSPELDKHSQTREAKMMQMHPQVGYKIIKNEMGLPEIIAKIALEHHEKNDGSGYPYGISGDLISLYTQVITVCNEYDVLTSHKGHVKVKNSKEAIRLMLDEGSKTFNPHVLYTFVHMANYNDPEEYDLRN